MKSRLLFRVFTVPLSALLLAVALQALPLKASADTAPVVSGVSPAAGPLSGGTTVTISGSGFTGATAVDFGGIAAKAFTVVSDSRITAWSPAQAAGLEDVTVTTADGQSATVPADQFSYDAIPVITGISPSAGPPGGGTSVTITGSGFTGVSAVEFGAVPAPRFRFVSDSEITVIAPPQNPATVDIAVRTPGGVSLPTSADEFTYTPLPVPSVTGVSPAAGPAAGGTSVTITGTALGNATAVKFGTTSATSFTVVSSTQITAISPARPAGTVDVSVTTPGGTSPAGQAGAFSYLPRPRVTQLSPAAGPTAGGTSVTISGTGFTDVSAVVFGTAPAASFTVVSGTEITAVSPVHAAGLVHITVVTPGGTSPEGTGNKFTYLSSP